MIFGPQKRGRPGARCGCARLLGERSLPQLEGARSRDYCCLLEPGEGASGCIVKTMLLQLWQPMLQECRCIFTLGTAVCEENIFFIVSCL